LRSGWYILLVKPGYENNIRSLLLSKRITLSIRSVVVSNGYIFIRSSKINASNFLCYEGALKFLGVTKEGPRQYTDKEIQNINREPKKQVKCFKIGDHVIVKKGDLSDIEGDIISISKKIVRIKSLLFEKLIRTNVCDIDFLNRTT